MPGRRRLITGLVALLVVGGGAAIPAHAATSAGVRQPDVEPLAAAPEVWHAFDNERVMSGSAHARFVFSVPAGSYAITAKLSANSNPGSADEIVECELSASSSNGNNWDRTNVLLDTPSDGESMALSVAHTFPGTGSIVLDCRHVFPGQGEVTTLFYVKIDATRVNALTYVPL
jgi:hypothetical protein